MSGLPTAPVEPPPPGGSSGATTAHLRAHPASPLVHALGSAPAAGALWLFYVRQFSSGAVEFLLLGVTLVAVGAVVAALRWVEWLRFEYWFDAAGDLRVDSGLVSRTERRVQLSRIQSVEVVQPLAARVVDMASVRVEVAGAGESNVTIGYLTHSGATELRNELVARSAGLAAGTAAASENVLVEVDDRELLYSLVLRGRTASLLLASVFFVGVTILTEGAGALWLALFTGGVPIFGIVGEYLRNHGFTVADSADGLRLRHGLTHRVANTVPPGRVQAVEFVDGWLWRRLGWVKVQLNLGGSAGEDDQDVARVLLPVASWDVALDVVRRVLPGVDVLGVPLRPAPRRSRWRAPWQSLRLAVGHDARVMVTRRGRLVHHLAVVPHERCQSLRVTQGLLERCLGLASLHVDSTPGPVEVVALHMDAAAARQLAEEEALRAFLARRHDHPERWMRARSGGAG